MLFDEQLDSYRPPFRQAYKEIRQDTPGVYGQKDLKLKESADPAAWEPDESILSYVPNFHKINIEMIDETTDNQSVILQLLQEKSIGLVVLGQEVCRDVKPSLVILTTSSVYFVIDPNAGDKGLSLLKQALSEPGLTLWTTNGLFEADSLFANYKIKLKDSNAKCCLGLHIHNIMALSAHKYDVTAYPEEARRLARGCNVKILKFHQLVRTWLSIDNTRIFELDPTQTIHFDTRPLSLTAKNLILKRCCLILKLAEALEFYTLTEFSTMNRHTLDCVSNPSQPGTVVMKDIIKDDEKNKVVSHIYLSHLDGPSLSAQPPKPLIPLSDRQSLHDA